MHSSRDVDVVVVGAGLAGLQCARLVQAGGRDVLVVEASDAVGGRVRTDVVDGYRCDRGFQLLNPAYPAVRRHVDLPGLDLRVFGRGVEVAGEDGTAVLADPLRHPDRLPGTLRSGLVRPSDLLPLARWAAPALGPVPRLLARRDVTLRESWDEAGLRGPVRDAVLAPFLTGVLAEGEGATSATYARLVVRSFARATPGVPARGMQALSDQLAVRPGRPVELGTPVRAVRRAAGGRVEVVTDTGTIRARAVVVATDAPAAGALLGSSLTVPPMRGLSTWWLACDEPPSTSGLLRVDGRGRGPVVNTAVMTAVAPSYAPPGRHLVEATTLLPASGAGPDEAEVRGHLERIWGAGPSRWEVVTRHDVRHALPAHPPGIGVRRPVDLGDGLLVAGDHRDTPSIQGALVSGARAAHAVRRHLARSGARA